MVTLKSSNGEVFVVGEAVARQSQVILHAIELFGADKVIHIDIGHIDNGIPPHKINSKIRSKVIEYCNKHVEAAEPSDDATTASVSEGGDDLKKWDAEFFKVDQATLVDLMEAANYLAINGLLKQTRQAVVDMMKGQTPEENCMMLIKNVCTPMEEEELLNTFIYKNPVTSEEIGILNTFINKYGFTPEQEEEIRNMFIIKYCLTPEEEYESRKMIPRENE